MTKKNDTVDVLMEDWRRERPDIDASPLAIFGRVSRLSAHLTRRAEKWLAPLNLTWESFSLIVTLRRTGAPYELRPGELLLVSLLTSGAITNRIDRVEQQGLVVRLRDPNDRRGVIVQLTSAGQKLADQAIAVHLEHMDALLAPLEKSERKVAGQILAKLLLSLETEPEEEVEIVPAVAAKKRTRKPPAGT
jgi:DNA-binding MarR family transcriptional regulator